MEKDVVEINETLTKIGWSGNTQVISCPFCEDNEISCLSTLMVTSQLTLFGVDQAETKTSRRSRDKFVCGCGATASLVWSEAKKSAAHAQKEGDKPEVI